MCCSEGAWMKLGVLGRTAAQLVLVFVCLGSADAAETERSTFACDGDVSSAASRILATYAQTMDDASRLPDDTDGVKARLAAMRRGDQDIRFLALGLMNRCARPPESDAMRPVVATWRAIDERNREALGRLLHDKGWPVRSRYGEASDQSAFLVAQHADRDPAFQKQVLDILEKAWRAKETSGENYALLFDRVRVREGEPQRYGSQGACSGKQWIPTAIENPRRVDERRRAVGLEAMRKYSARVGRLLCTGGT
jgi:hypothetical protein